MNYPFERLIEGLVTTMETHILPDLSDDFARGQAYGVVYMLRCIRQRAGWTGAYLAPQLAALADLADALRAILPAAEGAPEIAAAPVLGPDADEPAFIAARERLNRDVCAAYEWLTENQGALPAEAGERARAIMDEYLTVQLKTELAFDVPINFSEISTGKPNR